MITVRRAQETGLLGLQCGDEVKCADCGAGMHGVIWYAERLLGMHHTEPVVEIMCLPCARIAKEKMLEEDTKNDT